MTKLIPSSRCLRRPHSLLRFIAVVNLIGLVMFALLMTYNNNRQTPGHRLAKINQPSLYSDQYSRPCATHRDDDHWHQPIATSRRAAELRRPMTILVWNTKNDRWNHQVDLKPVGNDISDRRGCVFTTDKTRYNVSDGVVFYGDLMHLSKFPVAQRPIGQKWIYLSVETPVNTIHTGIKHIRLQRQKHVYNVTSTYSMTSDVPLPYFSETCQKLDQSKINDEETRSEIRNIIRSKRHLAAWLVSHCETSSRREKYVEELRKYVHVDIYGRCGPLNCSRVLANYTDNYYTACDDMVTRLYKFYLAFENSLCQDYVTEKFSRFLRRDIVTVVLGAANYTRFTRHDVYIDVRDFRSPKDLAYYLRELDERDDLYEEYLARKRSLRCEPMWLESHPERLCRHLWDNVHTTRTADLSSSLNANKVCTTPRAFYLGVADTINH